MALMNRREVREFKISWLIRAPILLALILWILIGGIAARIDGMPSYAFASIAFFVLFFMMFVTYYFSMTYIVHEYGVTVRGANEFEHFDWEDIVEIHSSELPLGGYYVTTTHGGFVLSSFVKGHRALVELIATRAGLMPMLLIN